MNVVKQKSSKAPKSKPKSKSEPKPETKPKSPGNIYDTFAKKMFGQLLVFIDFMLNYANKDLVSQIDLDRIRPAPTHYVAQIGDERIIDLLFVCPLKEEYQPEDGKGELTVVIIFEHQSESLEEIPLKILKYITIFWVVEKKEGKPRSAPYFVVFRTGKKPYQGTLPDVADSLPKGRDGKPLGGEAVRVKYDIVDLPAWDFEQLVGGPVLRLAMGVLKAMVEGDGEELPKALLPLLEITDENEQTELTQDVFDFADRVFKARNRRIDEAMVSRILKQVFHDEEKEKTMIKSIFDEKYDAGVAVGEARALMTVLRTKFKKVPKGIEKAILAMSDPIALESLTAHAVDSKTLDEFAEALQ